MSRQRTILNGALSPPFDLLISEPVSSVRDRIVGEPVCAGLSR
jgi:hypothetical protein